MKPATASVAGRSKIAAGAPICTISPSMKIAMRSASVMASSWSWVT